MGIGARKAIAAGLHKDVPSKDEEEWEVVEERRQTFWYFYFYETLDPLTLCRKCPANCDQLGVLSSGATKLIITEGCQYHIS